MKTEIQIIEFEGDKVVKTIDVTGKTERTIDKIDDGININLNHSDYYTRIVELTK